MLYDYEIPCVFKVERLFIFLYFSNSVIFISMSLQCFQPIQIQVYDIINKTATAPSNELAECVRLSNRCGGERRNGGLDCSQQIIIVTYPVDI